MHQTLKRHHRKELIYFDETNPRSLVRLVPPELAKLIKALSKSENRYLLGMTEATLKAELVRQGKCPTSSDNRIRLQFWLEYDRVQTFDRAEPMNMSYVIGFAIAKEMFYSDWATSPWRLAWLLCPVVNYLVAVEDALRNSLEVINALMLMALDQRSPSGAVPKPHLDFVLKAHAMLNRKVEGGLVVGGLPPKEGVLNDPDEGELVPPEFDPEVAREERRKRIEELRKQAEELAGKNAPKVTDGAE